MKPVPVSLVLLPALWTACATPAPAPPLDLGRLRVVDLSHPLGAGTLYWPTSPTRFRLDTLSYGQTPGGWFYSAFTFAAPEHGGTHVDAPLHFHAAGDPVDRIPLDRLVAPAVVIDVTEQAAADPDYRLTAEAVRAFEAQHGEIPAGAIVLLRTGWSARWPDARTYLGDDTPGDASNLHFPSYGEDAARLLVETRRVAALGIDAASTDYGASTDFVVHQVAAAAGTPGLENLTNLDALPPTGAVVVALPLKIEGGSGSPARVIALIPEG